MVTHKNANGDAAVGDDHLMANADPKLHESATARMKQRTDTVGAAVKEVATNPSIITDSNVARAKSN